MNKTIEYSELQFADRYGVNRKVLGDFRDRGLIKCRVEERITSMGEIRNRYFYTDRDAETLEKLLALSFFEIERRDMKKFLETEEIISLLRSKVLESSKLSDQKRTFDSKIRALDLLQETDKMDWDSLLNIYKEVMNEKERKEMQENRYTDGEIEVFQRDLHQVTENITKNAEATISEFIVDSKEELIESVESDFECELEDELETIESSIREEVEDDLVEEGYDLDDADEELKERLRIRMKEAAYELKEELDGKIEDYLEENIDEVIEDKIQEYIHEMACKYYGKLKGLDFINKIDPLWKEKIEHYLWNEYERTELRLDSDELYIIGMILFNRPIRFNESQTYQLYQGYNYYLKENYHQIKEVVEKVKSQNGENFINHLPVDIVKKNLEQLKEKYSNLFSPINVDVKVMM